MEEALDNDKGVMQIFGEKAHYLRRVLRYKKGESFNIVDGGGSTYICKVAEIDANAILFNYIKTEGPRRESSLDLILCPGLLKSDKMDMVIQKAIELGVKEIAPVITKHCVPKYTRRTERWKKIAISALNQSKRTVLPTIREACKFSELVEEVEKNGHKGVLFYEKYGRFFNEIEDLKDAGPFYVFVGPEGGFCEEEVNLVENAGIFTVTLGRRILRAETASICALSILQYLYGDLGPH